jgi:hypothetical protein
MARLTFPKALFPRVLTILQKSIFVGGEQPEVLKLFFINAMI